MVEAVVVAVITGSKGTVLTVAVDTAEMQPEGSLASGLLMGTLLGDRIAQLVSGVASDEVAGFLDALQLFADGAPGSVSVNPAD